MLSYIIAIFIFLGITFSATIPIAVNTGVFSLTYAILAPTIAMIYVLVLEAIPAIIYRFLPKALFNYKNWVFRIRKKEKSIYIKLGIRKWKDKIPELGWTAGFPKRHVKSNEAQYLGKFLNETCFAECLHFTSSLLGFTTLFFFPPAQYFFVIPIIIFNIILNTLPCLVQRYTRSRLVKVYELTLKKEANAALENVADASEIADSVGTN